MPRCGCHGNPARKSSGLSLRKSSSSRKGSNSEVLPNPKARRRCTPAPSMVGFDFASRLIVRTAIGGAPAGSALGLQVRLDEPEILVETARHLGEEIRGALV